MALLRCVMLLWESPHSRKEAAVKAYKRRSGGISKTLIFADFVIVVVAPAIGMLVEAGILSGTYAGIAIAGVGLVTRFLRQMGPTAK